MAPWITVLSWRTVFTKRVIYKFTLVWYSVKQGTKQRPTSHLVHWYTVPFIWPREKHRLQHSFMDVFTGQCWLWQLSGRTTFFAATLGPPTNLVLGQSWLFPASSVKFLTRSSLKSRWVYLASQEDNSIQALNLNWMIAISGPMYHALGQASHSYKMFTQVSFSVPHFLQVGLLLSPTIYKCLLKVLYPVRRPIAPVDCVLLKENNWALVARLGPETNSQACLYAL